MESPVQDRSREEESEQKVVQLDAEARKEDGEENELEKVKQDLQKTKAELDEAKSEVAVAQILQENLCSVSRQKVICIHPCIAQVRSVYVQAALEEELATMQILLSEATMDSQVGTGMGGRKALVVGYKCVLAQSSDKNGLDLF